jgi:hypothetical protein
MCWTKIRGPNLTADGDSRERRHTKLREIVIGIVR